MSAPFYQEEKQGAIASWGLNDSWFKVEFTESCKDWFADPREIMTGSTIGQSNRAHLHKLLDEVINRFIGGSNG